MKTTVYNSLNKNKEEQTIESNQIKFILDNEDCLIVKNEGDCIKIEKVSKNHDSGMSILPSFNDCIKIK